MDLSPLTETPPDRPAWLRVVQGGRAPKGRPRGRIWLIMLLKSPSEPELSADTEYVQAVSKRRSLSDKETAPALALSFRVECKHWATRAAFSAIPLNSFGVQARTVSILDSAPEAATAIPTATASDPSASSENEHNVV
jgi:hypothetical protein